MTDKQKVKGPSPTFIAKFDDGIVTRMTTYGGNGRLDLVRGIAVACAAYESRAGKRAPCIVAGKFVEPGCYDEAILKEYSARVLHAKQVATQPPPEQTTEPPEQTTKEAAMPEQIKISEEISHDQGV